MNSHYRQVVRSVRRVWWVQRLVGVLEATVVFWAGLVLCLIALTLLVGPLSASWAHRVVGLSAGVALPVLAALVWLARTPSMRRTWIQCALAIERVCHRDHNEVINAVQLGHEAMAAPAADTGVAVGLVESLVETVGRDMAQARPLNSVDATRLRRATVALLCVAAVGGLSCLWAPKAFGRAWQRLLRPGDEIQGVAVRQEGAVENATVGDIRLTYHYPLYTGLRPRVVANGSGHIVALKGTEVHIEATASVPLRGAYLVLSDGQTVPLQLDAARDAPALSGKIAVLEDGHYRFKLRPQDGTDVLAEGRYSITVDPDKAPGVRLDAKRLPREVAERGELSLPYEAVDDFGLSALRLVYRRGKKKESISLRKLSPPRKRYSDTYAWALAALMLRPGERVSGHIEAEDNDSISGPKVGRSATFSFEVFSERRKHRQIIELQVMLKKAMVHLLADQLEQPVQAPELARTPQRLLLVQENLRVRRATVIQVLGQIMAQMKDDSLGNFAHYKIMENMHERLMLLVRRRELALAFVRRAVVKPLALPRAVAQLGEVQEDEVRELESDLIYLHDLIQQQRIEDIRGRAEDLLSRQREVADLLEELAKNPNADLAQRAQELLKQIQEKLAELMMAMSKMASQLPQEFVNADALARASKQDMSDAAKEMMEAMDKGDMAAALQAARRLLAQLSKVLDSWQESSRSYAQNRHGQELGELQRMQEEISDLERREHELARQTNSIKRTAQRRAFGLMKRDLDEFFKKQLERLAEAVAALKAVERQIADDPVIKAYRTSFDAYMVLIREQAMLQAQARVEKDPEKQKAVFESLKATQERVQGVARTVNLGAVLRTLSDIGRQLSTKLDTAGKLKRALEAWDAWEALPLAEEMELEIHAWRRRVEKDLRRKPVGEEEKQRADQALPNLITSATRSHEIAEDLRKLREQLRAMSQQTLTQQERERLQQLAQQQDQIRQRTEALRQKAEQAGARMPFMSPRIGRALGGACASMQRAGQKLRGSQVGEALASERDAAAKLSQAKQMMQQACEMCQQGMMGGGMPMPGRGQRGGRGGSPDVNKVEIPSEDAHKVPRQFRQDIIDAMRRGLPERHKELNREYYRKLLE